MSFVRVCVCACVLLMSFSLLCMNGGGGGGGGDGCGCVCVYGVPFFRNAADCICPFSHFSVSLLCDSTPGRCSDELGCKPQ